MQPKTGCLQVFRKPLGSKSRQPKRKISGLTFHASCKRLITRINEKDSLKQSNGDKKIKRLDRFKLATLFTAKCTSFIGRYQHLGLKIPAATSKTYYTFGSTKASKFFFSCCHCYVINSCRLVDIRDLKIPVFGVQVRYSYPCS